MAQLNNTIIQGNATVTGNVQMKNSYAIRQNDVVTGTGTAGTTGSATAAYIPALWKFDLGLTPVEGDVITLKIPVAGVNSGAWLSVDNGTTYYPVASYNTNHLANEYTAGNVVQVVFEKNMTTSMYCGTTSGSPAGTEKSNFTMDRWALIDFYNVDTQYPYVLSEQLIEGVETDAHTISANTFRLAMKGVITEEDGAMKVYENEVGTGYHQGINYSGKNMIIGTDGKYHPAQITSIVRNEGIQDNSSDNLKQYFGCAENVPMEVKIEVKPYQNLNGYDGPWPAGLYNLLPDGTNTSNGYKLNYYLTSAGVEVSGSGNYITEYFPVEAGVTYSFGVGTGYGSTTWNLASVCFYNSSKQYISGVPVSKILNQKVIAPENAAYARGTQATAPGGTTPLLQFIKGSTPTKSVPYKNICAISGYTNGALYQTNKNLFNIVGQGTNAYTITDGVGVCSYSYGVSGRHMEHYVYVSKSGKMTLSATVKLSQDDSDTSTKAVIGWKPNASGGAYGKLEIALDAFDTWQRISYTSDVNAGDKLYIGIQPRTSGHTVTFKDVQLEFGGEMTDYQEYNGNVCSIAFPNGDIIYGGSIIIHKDGSGEITTNRAYVVPDFSSWTLNSSSTDAFWKNFTNKKRGANTAICSHFPIVTYSTSDRILVDHTTYTSASDLQEYQTAQTAAGTPIQIVYELANPTTVPITATQVKTLLGTNLIFADTGDILYIHTDGIKEFVDAQKPGLATHSANGLMSSNDKAKIDVLSSIPMAAGHSF